MKFRADLHIHSHYSIATSKLLTPEQLDYWAGIKGLKLIGSGDFTHPGWLKEMKEKLEMDSNGLYQLKQKHRLENSNFNTKFILSAELSTIYKKNGKVRKLHQVLLAPDFETVEAVQEKLLALGFNITSDGRPILGFDSKHLLEMLLEINDKIFFIPAHIWTPWFSVLGSKSGFDSLKECFEDMSQYIYTIETGLSTDPPLNWMCSFLDEYSLISNSDAHSPEKLGRNANIFDTDLSYEGIIKSLRTKGSSEFIGTIDLFPQEGKYHNDGHRKCAINWNPVERLKNNGICPVCGKPVTLGVVSRIAQLSDRDSIEGLNDRRPFYSIIPFKELLAEIYRVKPGSKKVEQAYTNLIHKHGFSELDILLDVPIPELEAKIGAVLTEGIRRMREGEVHITEGFDGEYGIVRVFSDDEKLSGYMSRSLFSDSTGPHLNKRSLFLFNLSEFRQLNFEYSVNNKQNVPTTKGKKQNIKHIGNLLLKDLNPNQIAAITDQSGPCVLIAGPGTGKTKVLTTKIAWLITEKKVPPEEILALTFSRRAAEEMRQRLQTLIPDSDIASRVQLLTFHAFGYKLLNNEQQPEDGAKLFIDNHDKKYIIRHLHKDSKTKNIQTAIKHIIGLKNKKSHAKRVGEDELLLLYLDYLGRNDLTDYSELIEKPLQLSERKGSPFIPEYEWVLIDEFQDLDESQFAYLKFLAPRPDSNIMAIGDPFQSIYGFRGAKPEVFESFKAQYKTANTIFLSQSYRCSLRILKASGNIMRANGADNKEILAKNNGIKVKISGHYTQKGEAEFIARQIESMIGGLRFFSFDSNVTDGDENAAESLSDFAVLCRTSNQFDAIKKAFHDHSIPFQEVGGAKLAENNTIRMILDFLRLTQNQNNAFLRQKVESYQIKGVDSFFIQSVSGLNVVEIIHEIKKRIEKISAGDEVELTKMLHLAKEFDSDINSFIQRVMTGESVDFYEKEIEKVSLLTLHASKGLEFKCVFIAGCEDGLIPFTLFEKQKTDIEEEKRLLYVGMTRAKDYLILTYAGQRNLKNRLIKLPRSRFIEKIEKDLLEKIDNNYLPDIKSGPQQLSLFG